MKRVINNILNNKRTRYLLFVTVLFLFALILNISYSAFTSSNSNAVANIKVKDMSFNISIDGVATRMITATANDITKSNVTLISLNNIDAKYELIYDICSDQNCETIIEQPEDLLIEYSSKSIDGVSDTILQNSAKVIRIVSTNTSNNTYYIRININAGYTHNSLALKEAIIHMYDEDDITIAAYIDGELSTTFPTTSFYHANISCMADGHDSAASSEVIWNGTKWVVNVTGVDTGETRCNVSFEYDESLIVVEPNSPLLSDNMIPVYYDSDNDVWIKADATNPSYSWYKYDEQKWANAVTVISNKRTTYNEASIGTQIPMSDILGMWVWIPRYEYKIDNPGLSVNAEEIHIKFVSGVSTSNSNGYLIHPAFRNGTVYKHTANYDLGGWDSEILGLWFGKFEVGYATNRIVSSTLSSNILIKPNVYSVRMQTISQQYQTSGYIKSTHGLNANTDSHMTKNTEWGAAAYLSTSKYGKFGNPNFVGANKEVYVNNAYYAYQHDTRLTTGRSAGIYSGGTNSYYTDYGKYEYNDCPASDYAASSCTATMRAQNHLLGTGASTTGNIYGIYDMSGGAVENVMGNYMGYSGSSSSWNSGFTGPLGDGTSLSGTTFPSQKYWDIYTSYDMNTLCNGVPCLGIGNANETGSNLVNGKYNWFEDYMYIASNSGDAWRMRGYTVQNSNGGETGIFASSSTSGFASYPTGFRATLIITQ